MKYAVLASLFFVSAAQAQDNRNWAEIVPGIEIDPGDVRMSVTTRVTTESTRLIFRAEVTYTHCIMERGAIRYISEDGAKTSTRNWAKGEKTAASFLAGKVCALFADIDS